MPSMTTVTALITDAGGSPATSGVVDFELQLNSEAQLPRVAGTSIFAPMRVRGTINAAGQLKAEDGVSALTIWGNDTISPASTWYTARIAANGSATQDVGFLLISGATYNLATPTFYEAVSFIPDTTPPPFEAIQSNLIPAVTGQYTLGSDQKKYASLYVQQIFSDQNTFPGSPSVFNSIDITGTGSIAHEPYPGYGLAYGSFLQTYTANKPAGNEWVHEIVMDSSLAGEKLASAIVVNQHAGSGSVWGMNIVVTADTGVGHKAIQGIEIDLNDNNIDSITAGDDLISGLTITGAGSHLAMAAIVISGVGHIWSRGIYFDVNNSILTNSIDDEGNAINSYLMQGVHTNGIKAIGGSFSNSVFSIPNNVPITADYAGIGERSIVKLDGSNLLELGYTGMAGGVLSLGDLTSTTFVLSKTGVVIFGVQNNTHASLRGLGLNVFCRDATDTAWTGMSAGQIYANADTTAGGAGSTSLTNTVNTTVTNAYVVKGGQAATTPNSGWIKFYRGATPTWVPCWDGATP